MVSHSHPYVILCCYLNDYNKCILKINVYLYILYNEVKIVFYCLKLFKPIRCDLALVIIQYNLVYFI